MSADKCSLDTITARSNSWSPMTNGEMFKFRQNVKDLAWIYTWHATNNDSQLLLNLVLANSFFLSIEYYASLSLNH